MFNLASFFIGFKYKLLAIGIAAGLALAFYWSWASRGADLKQLQGENAVARTSIAGLEKTVKEEQGSADIKEQINTEEVAEAQQIATRQDDLASRRRTAVANIDRTFDAMTATPLHASERDNATSAAMIDGLWSSYCAGQPAAPQCVKTP
ncbi:hypothetical protein [Rugamonas aquatica]|uniref:Uncharacterized protein n=1 Tax=Rugamonas aquatica TaxID=2743357 RepID=A0A6A7N8I1_9BURK|nr:hypothetical protein [Rugamonas aquatica]MQA41395.1 hypothetical protein [Rugamonas aquatica]